MLYDHFWQKMKQIQSGVLKNNVDKLKKKTKNQKRQKSKRSAWLCIKTCRKLKYFLKYLNKFPVPVVLFRNSVYFYLISYLAIKRVQAAILVVSKNNVIENNIGLKNPIKYLYNLYIYI